MAEDKKTKENKAFKDNESKTWKDIKDKELNLFGIKDLLVKDYVFPKEEINGSLCVTLKVSAVLPALEEVLSLITDKNDKKESYQRYTLEQCDNGYLMIHKTDLNKPKDEVTLAPIFISK